MLRPLCLPLMVSLGALAALGWTRHGRPADLALHLAACRRPAPTLASTPATPASTPAPVLAPPPPAPAPLLNARREGDLVRLEWTLPEGDFRLIEIYRNASAEAKGRGRVGTTRATTKTWTDKPTDSAPAWYWLKLIREDGSILNIGPVASPAT